MRAIALYGGTFDPVHLGHTHALSAACGAVEFDRVFILPVKIPPHKEAHMMASEKDRLNMCRIAFGGFENVTVSDLEFHREGKSYSYYTVKYFSEKYPDSRIYFIMGSDMLLSFKTWHRADELLSMCTPLCVSRSQSDTAAAKLYAERLSEELNCGMGAVFAESEPFEISSTRLRELISEGRFSELNKYMDKNVLEYITERKLYSKDNRE